MFGLIKARWKHSDPKVREQAARRLSDDVALLQLALGDVSESVRTAAAKSLNATASLETVAQEGVCEASRTIALMRLEEHLHSVERLLADAASDSYLISRILALYGDRLGQDCFFEAALVHSSPETKVKIAEKLVPSERCHRLLQEDSPDELKKALLPKILDQGALRELSNEPHSLDIRLGAIAKLEDADALLDLSQTDPTPAIRLAAIARLPLDHPTITKLLEYEDNVLCRAGLCSRLTNEATLLRCIRAEPSREVRAAAARALTSVEAIAQLIADETLEHEIRRELVNRLDDEDELSLVCLTNDDDRLRLLALSHIDTLDTIQRIHDTAAFPALRWAASRRLGQADLQSFWKIDSDVVIEAQCKEETDAALTPYLVRRINSRHALEDIANGDFPSSQAAAERLDQPTGPCGIRFVGVPDRPYEITAFFLTRREVHELLGYSASYRDPMSDELPAVGVTLPEVEALCQRLNQIEGLDYRLPTFDEWLHACQPDRYPIATAASGEDSPLPPAIHLRADAPRSRIFAFSGVNGILDPIGNLLTLVADDSLNDDVVRRLAPTSPLSKASVTHAPPASEFAFAAGNHWAEPRLTPGRLERLVWQNEANPAWKDKTGIRLLRDRTRQAPNSRRYRIVLDPTPREGYDREEVIRSAARNLMMPPAKVHKFFEVAPVEVLGSQDYEHIRNQRRCWQRSGARVTVE